MIENLPDGMVLIGERLDDSIEAIQPKTGDEPPASTAVTIGSEAQKIAGNRVVV